MHGSSIPQAVSPEAESKRALLTLRFAGSNSEIYEQNIPSK